MKILIYFLISSLLFISGWCKDDDEGDCTKLEKEITVKIYAEMIDRSEDQACKWLFAVDFWKVHCGGGPSGTMTYLFEGCYEEEEDIIIPRVGTGSWDVTFRNKEDILHVDVINHDNKLIGSDIIDGDMVYSLTNSGINGLHVTIMIDRISGTKPGMSAKISFY